MAEKYSPEPEPSEALYDRCNKAALKSTDRFQKTFTQDELLALCDSKPLDKIQDARTLMPVIQELSDSMLFIVLKSKGGTCWALRPRDAAAKIKDLSTDERMIYSFVEESHKDGTWIKNLSRKTGIKDYKSLKKTLSKLERMCLIKYVSNINVPSQKTYILFHLAPSEDLAGGSFYEAGALDTDLIEELSNLIIFHVRQMSWVEDKKKRIKREAAPITIQDDTEPAAVGAPDPPGRKKRKRESNTAQTKDIEDAAPPRKRRSHKHQHNHDAEMETVHYQHAFQAGHEYPTAASIHEYVTSNNIIRAIKAASLTVDEIQNILNVLVWDEKLEKVNGGYRTVRGVKFRFPGEDEDEDELEAKSRGNAFTEMPCGRCPVIDICGNGGPISVENCVYFDIWLGRKQVPEKKTEQPEKAKVQVQV